MQQLLARVAREVRLRRAQRAAWRGALWGSVAAVIMLAGPRLAERGHAPAAARDGASRGPPAGRLRGVPASFPARGSADCRPRVRHARPHRYGARVDAAHRAQRRGRRASGGHRVAHCRPAAPPGRSGNAGRGRVQVPSAASVRNRRAAVGAAAAASGLVAGRRPRGRPQRARHWPLSLAPGGNRAPLQVRASAIETRSMHGTPRIALQRARHRRRAIRPSSRTARSRGRRPISRASPRATSG